MIVLARLDLTMIPEPFHTAAADALESRNVGEILCTAGNMDSPRIVFLNLFVLCELGLYEATFSTHSAPLARTTSTFHSKIYRHCS
jgi:hypothetical protein